MTVIEIHRKLDNLRRASKRKKERFANCTRNPTPPLDDSVNTFSKSKTINCIPHPAVLGEIRFQILGWHNIFHLTPMSGRVEYMHVPLSQILLTVFLPGGFERMKALIIVQTMVWMTSCTVESPRLQKATQRSIFKFRSIYTWVPFYIILEQQAWTPEQITL